VLSVGLALNLGGAEGGVTVVAGDKLVSLAQLNHALLKSACKDNHIAAKQTSTALEHSGALT
jgi:hypothetical protein